MVFIVKRETYFSPCEKGAESQGACTTQKCLVEGVEEGPDPDGVNWPR